jgi:2-polyprenyl-3-methyl-5-hydroxy-6-metoxy-1,4-benzoquinol methylase
MTAGTALAGIHSSRLSEWVKAVNERQGNWLHDDLENLFGPFNLRFDTHVDQNLDPFSEVYVAQQLSLYREISGRDFDQSSGELHRDDTRRLLNAPNPTGIASADKLAEYVRCVSTMQSLACLDRPAPHVLDVGAGHGLGSEVIAYTGCRVDAIDIDPALSLMSETRAASRGLPIRRHILNFDDLSPLADDEYDAAFFFQSLHHSLRPWRLIEDLRAKLTPDGVIAFVGEPLQETYWLNWGVRLDNLSVYVARDRGWFESGWSHDFMRRCFRRAGLSLAFYTGGYLGGEIGIATASEEKREAIAIRARAIGLRPFRSANVIEFRDEQFESAIGIRTNVFDTPAFEQIRAGSDALLYGPYTMLAAGHYEFAMLAETLPQKLFAGGRQRLLVDVSIEAGTRRLFATTVREGVPGLPQLVTGRFETAVPVKALEIRAFAQGPRRWQVTLPKLRRLE